MCVHTQTSRIGTTIYFSYKYLYRGRVESATHAAVAYRAPHQPIKQYKATLRKCQQPPKHKQSILIISSPQQPNNIESLFHKHICNMATLIY